MHLINFAQRGYDYRFYLRVINTVLSLDVWVYNPECSSWFVPLLWSFPLDCVEVWLALVQNQFLSSCMCACVNMFVISWGLLKCSMYNEMLFLLQWCPFVCLHCSSVGSMTWLIVLWGPRAWLAITTSHHHNRPARSIWPAMFYCQLTNTFCLSNYFLYLISVNLSWPSVKNQIHISALWTDRLPVNCK